MVDESRKEMADREARPQADQELEHAYATRAANWCSWFGRGIPVSFFSSSFFFVFFLRSILRDFHFLFFSFFLLLLISLMKGVVVWRGWMTSLILPVFRIV